MIKKLLLKGGGRDEKHVWESKWLFRKINEPLRERSGDMTFL